jgi:cytochrome c553
VNGDFNCFREASMKREYRIRSAGVKLCALGMIFSSCLALAASHYTDLRNVEPIHGDAAAGATKAKVCFACHGENGTSVAPIFPRLAGQRVDYLYHRLLTFKRASAKDPYYSKSPMTAMAVPLSDSDMRNLAAFFASQEPQPAAPTTPAVNPEPTVSPEKGERLFRTGDPARGIPPCQGCHGVEAKGTAVDKGPYLVYPVLRGQYSPYLVSRLTNFRMGLPHDSTSDFIMSNVARTLDDDSLQAIAGWLSSLPPAKSL